MDYAERKALVLGAKRIVVGLNAHVSIGVGMLNHKLNEGPVSFNSVYSKIYYPDFSEMPALRKALCRLTGGILKMC